MEETVAVEGVEVEGVEVEGVVVVGVEVGVEVRWIWWTTIHPTPAC